MHETASHVWIHKLMKSSYKSIEMHLFILFIYFYLALHMEWKHRITKVGKDF